MKYLGKPITQRQLRVGEMIKQALGTLFIDNNLNLDIWNKSKSTFNPEFAKIVDEEIDINEFKKHITENLNCGKRHF